MIERTTDIVTEARIRAEWGVPDFTNSNLLDALCDEIERLRKVIAIAKSVCGQNNCNCPGAPSVKVALEALHG